MELNIVIIDDEPDAVESLSALVQQFIDGATVVGTAKSALEGIKIINQTKPDVVLLDVDMPGGNGFELLETFPDKKFKVIFTTASSEFALKALKMRAEDYLLKPIDIDELQNALNGIKSNGIKSNFEEARIPLPHQNGYTYIKIKDIIHIDGDGNYSTVYYTDNKKEVVSKNIKYFEDLLTSHHFYRCHQSHIINLEQVKQLKKNEGFYLIMSNGNRVDVSRTHKDEVMKLLNG